MKLKSLKEQVVVLVGASSGIGRVTARQFAAAGARVVVAARSEEGLQTVVDEIVNAGGKAVMQVADVTDLAQVEALAAYAVESYGTIDTWVHLAGVGIAAEHQTITTEEFRKVLDINVVGMFHGVRAAIPHMRERGGAFIGIGSVESTVAFPFHSAYAASKHAVAGLLDGVRIELMHEGVPVSVTNIRPAAIDTPFFEREPTKLGVQPNPPPPVYRPEDVASAILHAATRPVRDLYVGGGGRIFSALKTIAPAIADRLIAATQWDIQKTDEPKGREARSGLEGPDHSLDRDTGNWHGRPSIYTWIRTNPKTSLALAAAAVGATAAIVHEVAEKQRERDTIKGQLGERLSDLRDDFEPYLKQAGTAWDRLVASARDAASRWS